MKKISIKELIEFRRKSDRGKKTFADNLKSNKIEVPTEGGGDYWIASLSAICNSYRLDDIELVDDKIDVLKGKLQNTSHSITKNMYQRNISILEKYRGMSLKMLRPNGKLSFLKKSSVNPIITIKGLEIECKPSHIYTFGTKDAEKVGAIWFTAKVNGYKLEEVGVFCEMLYKFLRHNYSNKYELAPKYCTAIDMLSDQIVNYSQIESGSVVQALTPTLDELNKLL
ncbi:hypothetical protein [Pseudoflavitalea rhizosphaerae]|uniref:hypothetical protein n=1 Tax=Pseudoflavitalea rhizosphaerae TaxID=1884793 RepID=UPI000F8E8448|nr:hypothetical protein [Pseudoflavitalea rhizosphaerae]